MSNTRARTRTRVRPRTQAPDADAALETTVRAALTDRDFAGAARAYERYGSYLELVHGDHPAGRVRRFHWSGASARARAGVRRG